MRCHLFAVACLATGSFAQAPAPIDADQVTALNRSRAEALTTAAAANAQQEADYRRQLADYQAAKARNDQERARAEEAERQFRAASADHDADMARWRIQVAGNEEPVAKPTAARAASVGTAAPDDRRICRAEQETGSHLSKHVCMTAGQWQAQETGHAGRDAFEHERSNVAATPH